MRRQLQKSHLLVKRSSSNTHGLSPHLARPGPSLKSQRLRSLPTHLRRQNRLVSSSAAAPVGPNNEGPTSGPASVELSNESISEAGPSLEFPPEPPANNAEEPEKPTVRITRRTRASSAKEPELPELPEGLYQHVLHTPSGSFMAEADIRESLPPDEMFQEALDKLLITLHPQNQARSILPASNTSRPVEPTLGLYCPIEGGDYTIDLTVHELAYQAGAEIVTLDAVHLVAGEWGMFGKAANALDLQHNPLHFSLPSSSHQFEGSRRKPQSEDDHDQGEPPFLLQAQPMSITLPKALSSLAGRVSMPSASRKPSTPSKLDLFFEALVNLPSPSGVDANSKNVRPRIVYVRDFPTLASSSSTWYPSLLYAVRQRRRALLRGSDGSPVAIIFGMTPPIVQPWRSGSSGSRTSLMSLLMSRNNMSPQVTQDAKAENIHDWTESETAEAAREKRLRSRLKRWEKRPQSFQEEFPKLQGKEEGAESGGFMPEIVVLASPNGAPVQPGGMPFNLSGPQSEEDQDAQFFRSVIIVPKTRAPEGERVCRMNRRREINELTMRMAVGTVGGTVETAPAFEGELMPETPNTPKPPSATPTPPMLEDWKYRVELWGNVRKIADRAIGSVMAHDLAQGRAGLDNTVVTWSALQDAWVSTRQLRTTRNSWIQGACGDNPGDAIVEEDSNHGAPGSSEDKVVEGIKNDPDLDQHEARLLPCIVDANSMTTTFNQVHLPSSTIDAVRTIVSLRLLHPHAFQQGILKEHGMTGCLLFGPPGTGKTLVVRALAKEAGCRMLVISPSDVMDMYVGEGEKLVRGVFSLARKLSPCVVFLDEIDALFGARMSARESGSAHAHRGVITEFMQEMDGLKSSKEDNVIVIGATNRPFDLDDAVLRRLPRRLLVDLPGENERAEILKILLRDESLDSDVNVHALSKLTDGFSGSDLKHLCVSAALDSVKEHMALPWDSRHSKAATAIASRTTSTPTAPTPNQEKLTLGPAEQLTHEALPVKQSVAQSRPEVAATDLERSSYASTNEEPSRLSKAPTMKALTEDSTISQPAESVELEGSSNSRLPSESLGVEAAAGLETSAEMTEEPGVAHTPEPAQPPLKGSLAQPKEEHRTRVLHLRHFTQALKEITPSSSESLGSLSELRKWNEEFGEGRRDRKKRQVWGKGRFGFINALEKSILPEGRVAEPQ